MISADGKEFVEWLTGLREGRLVNEAAEQFAKVVEGVVETGGAGTMTITLKVATDKDNPDVAVVIDQVGQKVPEDRRDNFFFDKAGRLRRSRPTNRNDNQTTLPIDLDTGGDPPREGDEGDE